MEEDEFALASWQIVVDDNVQPDSVAPEPKVKDAGMILVGRPVLVLRVNYHLSLADTDQSSSMS